MEIYQNLQLNKKICDLKPHDKNIDIKIMVIQQMIKNQRCSNGEFRLYQFLVSDNTGSILCNFYDEWGEKIKEGDILVLRCAYVSIYKSQMILYTSR